MDESVRSESSGAYQTLENLRLRLLDLTARNRLINYRHSKTGSLRVIDELPDQLVETLLADTEMRFQSIPEPTEKQLIEAGYLKLDDEAGQVIRLRNDPSAEEWAGHLEFSTSYEVPQSSANRADKHSDNAIQTLLYPFEMEARLKTLHQTAESAVHEMGANILYLAFGFLEWYESASSDSARIAPLFLVPVRLQKGRLNPATRVYEYTLSYTGEDIIPNLSLREKLRADFAMSLPDLDESIVPEDYLKDVHELIENKQPRWKVRRYISLTLLNFSRLLMYLDLDPSRWPKGASIVDHPLVSRFLSGYSRKYDIEGESPEDFGFGEEYFIDEIDDIHTKYPLIDDADSSQHSALIDAMDGKNLVIEGPPGTGKSQTITNLIAASIAQGKKVLFVAEKLAALEVVRRRLDAAGLGEFCLELHSHKSQKRKILDEIGTRLDKHEHYRKPEEIDVNVARYEELKTKLKNHAQKVGQRWKNTGKTLHEIFMGAARFRMRIDINPERLRPDCYDGNNYTIATHRRNEDQVQAYCKVYQAVLDELEGGETLQDHPWFGVCNDELQFFDLNRVMESLGLWQEALISLQEQREAIALTLGCDPPSLAERVGDVHALLQDLESIPSLNGDEILESLPVLRGDVLTNAQRYLALFEKIQVLYVDLAKKIGPAVFHCISVVDQLLPAKNRLEQIVGSDIKLGSLTGAINRLTAVEKQIFLLEEPLRGVSSSIGGAAPKYLKFSVSGLLEFQTAIDIIASLKSAHWKYRDEKFDNEELDELLPRLRLELESLLALQDKLRETFNLSEIPNESEIRLISSTLAAGGVLRWLKGDWRKARRRLLSHARNPKTELSTMISLLDDAAIFSGKRSDLEQNAVYKAALGDYLRGLETDLAALEALREWYKRVRQQYGVGFGQRVSIGDSILTMSPADGKAVRSLAERGTQTQLSQLCKELEDLKDVFPYVEEIHDDQAILIGEQGFIPCLLSEMHKVIQALGPLFNDDELTVAELADRIDGINYLKEKLDTWKNADYDNKLFKGKLGLVPGNASASTVGLARLRNTLKIAACINGQLSNQALIQYIYDYPVKEALVELKDHIGDLFAAVEAEQSSSTDYVDLVDLNQSVWFREAGDNIDAMLDRNQLALDNEDSLQKWIDYVRVRNQLESFGMARLADAVDSNEIAIERVEDAYRAAIFDLLAREILREDRELAQFSGHSQEALQDSFKNYDNRLKRLQCEQIAWKADQIEVPSGKMAARVGERTELALLKLECGKRTRHIPIRQLLLRAGNAIAALKPCFMMGPMSVAQYLAPGQIAFDLVVMDEASQVKPQDALGAIARGGQLIVVGDPKQLPPTSFFDRIVEDDEEDATGLEESESILDATLPMFSTRRLRWHYRSQHEALIAFSNCSFYGGDLVIFPSPHKTTDNFGIQYTRVPRGCFVVRRNMEEARSISEAVRDHFKRRPEETLGVVAMNAEQRLHIERAIETLAKDDFQFQEVLERDLTRHEPLFIKNLENVQGDERDVIFISMTYGPQEPGGKVNQRFGPINSDMGWRRLNVLFTRSKKRMHIFSSMSSDDIIIGPNSKRGVKALRDFLSYCETGILHKTERDTGRGPDSDFEIAVVAALRDEGFECIHQVGVAGFFIDVAVVDPGNSGRYLMGIECDGATYHSAKSARDRDRLRQAILERLGWRIRRIWSTDWFKNSYGELSPIIRELHQLKSTSVPVESADMSEFEKSIEILGDFESVSVDNYIHGKHSLRETLIRFDREVIRLAFPETAERKRLLRPAMLEALMEFKPTSKSEFLEMIPSYIRQGTDATEGVYMDQIFEIINSDFGVY